MTGRRTQVFTDDAAPPGRGLTFLETMAGSSLGCNVSPAPGMSAPVNLTSNLDSLPEITQSFVEISSLECVEAMAQKYAVRHGYDSVFYYRFTKMGRTIRPEVLIGPSPEAWSAHYWASGYARIDPVMPMVFRSTQSFTISEVETQYGGKAEIYADRRALWGEDGLICPIWSAGGEVGAVVWRSEERLEISAQHRLEMSALSHLIVTSIRRLEADGAEEAFSLRPLSHREQQCVYWLSEGKSATDIASILGISSHTVRQYIEASVLKLKAKNRDDMIARAGILGLISPE